MSKKTFIGLSGYFFPSYTTRRFKSHFGTSPLICSLLWEIVALHPQGEKLSPIHILWTLYFLKVYPTSDLLSGRLRKDPKTVKKYLWMCLYVLNDQLIKTDIIKWENRHLNGVPIDLCVILDVTECRIECPIFYEWEYYSVKEKKHTLKYEVAITLKKPHLIVWVNGPFKGSTHDKTISDNGIGIALEISKEKCLADKGYIGSSYCIYPYKPPRGHQQRMFNKYHYKVRQSIERCFKRVKQFHCLKNTWRHSIQQHPIIFAVTCYITQLNLYSHPLTKK